MVLIMFSIRDARSGIFLTPFPARSEIDAMRQISAGHNDPSIKNTPIGQSPRDFDLMRLGKFDDETGVFLAENPTILRNIADIVAKPAEPASEAQFTS